MAVLRTESTVAPCGVAGPVSTAGVAVEVAHDEDSTKSPSAAAAWRASAGRLPASVICAAPFVSSRSNPPSNGAEIGADRSLHDERAIDASSGLFVRSLRRYGRSVKIDGRGCTSPCVCVCERPVTVVHDPL